MVSFFVSFVDVVLTFRKNQDVEFTFVLPAGATECFYQTITDQNSMEVEYQVRQMDRFSLCNVIKGCRSNLTKYSPLISRKN